jgi:hypothetical protein
VSLKKDHTQSEESVDFAGNTGLSYNLQITIRNEFIRKANFDFSNESEMLAPMKRRNY